MQFPHPTSGHKNASAARTRSLLEGPPASGAYNESGTASVAAQPGGGANDAPWWTKHRAPNGAMTVLGVGGGPSVADLVDAVLKDEYGEGLVFDSVPAAHSTCDAACR